MKLAPIIIFAFNRLEPLQNTIKSLLKNKEAKDSDIYFFVDGPRQNKTGEKEKVENVRNYIRQIDGFKNVHFSFSDTNQGLGKSIIKGVTEIINKYNNAIILEDDLIFSSNFLSFMNQQLYNYEKNTNVFSICGYTNEIVIPKDYFYDSYFCTRSSSWGWATWKDRWNSVDWELNNWEFYKKKKHDFNKWGGSDCFGMLEDWKNGKNQSWAIRFCFSQFLQNKLSLFPTISKVQNDGFDGLGTNCKKWSRFKCILDKSNQKDFTNPKDITINRQIFKSVIKYHSIHLRIWSKLMYFIYS